jgi:hypothetical protein
MLIVLPLGNDVITARMIAGFAALWEHSVNIQAIPQPGDY